MDVQQIAETIAGAYIPQPAGGPSLIGDAAIVGVLLSELRAGVHLEPACLIAGLSVDTVKRWMKLGEQGQAPYELFLRAVNSARAGIEAEVTRNILAASKLPAYWTAGATYLERTHPARWAKPSDRQDRNSAAIEVHVHGVQSADVLIGVTVRDTAPSNTSSILSNNEGDSLIESQVLTLAPGADGTYAHAPAAVSAASAQPASDGAASPGGPQAPAVATSEHAVERAEKRPPAVQAVEKSLEALHQGVPQSTKRRTRAPHVVHPELVNAAKSVQRYASPAAVRRMRLLHREAQLKRKKKKLARAYADSVRHAANRAEKKAETLRRQAEKAEHALPSPIVSAE